MKEHKNEYVVTEHLDIDAYQPVVGRNSVDELRRLAEPLQGKTWVNVSSTFVGGGVAEMLQRVLPFTRALGINTRWLLLHGSEEFFKVTKKFHNMLQGMEMPITLEEIFNAYLGVIDENAKNMFIASHLVVVHDPQPAALIINGGIYGNTLWRCHIDTSNANRLIWKFFLPYINLYSGVIFTMREFAGEGLQVPIFEIAPCIDPIRGKNRECSRSEALSVLSDLFGKYRIDADRPIVVAVSRYDIHKNQKGIVRSFKLLKEKYRNKKNPPILILLGNSAPDDPEGGLMLEEIEREIDEDPDIYTWVNVENNDQVVGALMHAAKVFVHISTREGFGLVVSEAMWQGTPVIGSRIGGSKSQVLNGKTGFLVDPEDYRVIASKIEYLLEHADEAIAMGQNAKEHVRRHFLLPRLIRDYLMLMRYYIRIDNEPPRFRLNELSYREVASMIDARPWKV